MAAVAEAGTESAKGEITVSRGLVAILASLAGAGVTLIVNGSSAPPPEPQPLATIGAVTSAAESRAQSVAFAEASKLRTEVQGDLSRHKSDLADAINRLTNIQEKQATDLSTIKAAVARIEGQLSVTARRR